MWGTSKHKLCYHAQVLGDFVAISFAQNYNSLLFMEDRRHILHNVYVWIILGIPRGFKSSKAKSVHVHLYSIQRKTWVPHMNYKQTKKQYVHVEKSHSLRVCSSIQARLKPQVLFKIKYIFLVEMHSKMFSDPLRGDR